MSIGGMLCLFGFGVWSGAIVGLGSATASAYAVLVGTGIMVLGFIAEVLERRERRNDHTTEKQNDDRR